MNPHTTRNIRKLEMVQRQYARFICGDYRRTSSVTTMLNQLQWPTLQDRRKQAKIVMMYRFINGQSDIPCKSEYLIPADTSILCGHNQKLRIPFSRTVAYRHSFFPDGIRLWNSLTQQLVEIPSVESFKLRLQSGEYV